LFQAKKCAPPVVFVAPVWAGAIAGIVPSCIYGGRDMLKLNDPTLLRQRHASRASDR
jgi:hypothetical protein